MPNTKAVGVAYSDPALDGAVIGASGGTAGFFGSTPTTKPAANTAALTTITSTAPGTPDYAMVGFTLKNTLSDHGSVARGVSPAHGRWCVATTW
mgnify:CR=1 FL=1